MTKIESISIVRGDKLSDVDRASNKIKKEDFVEIRVVKNSPLNLQIVPIRKGVKPTEGFRNAIIEAGLLNAKF